MRGFAGAPKTSQNAPAKTTALARAHPVHGHRVTSILHVPRPAGNQALQPTSLTDAEDVRADAAAAANHRLGHDWSRVSIAPPAVKAMQMKLAINAPGDSYEQEADRVAEHIMRMPEPHLQRKCACGGTPGLAGECEECGRKRLSLQRMRLDAAGPVAGGVAPPIVHGVLRAPGRALDAATRAFMEPRFGHDFSRVRIHADAGANCAADAVQAQAFTVGGDIVFGNGKFAPSTAAGRALLAHELTHVVQQGAAPSGDLRALSVPAPARLQRQPKGGKDSPKTEACPPMERGEREEAAKAPLRLVERIPQQEWLIFGFPIGGSAISRAEAGGFIDKIVRSLSQGHFVYMTGQDPLEVRGFSDCFAGPQFDNQLLRARRAAEFCAGVQDNYAATPKTYPALIRSCGPAAADQYVESNATREGRAQNRGILIRRVATSVQFQEGNESFPYDPKYGPSEAHCAAYATDLARAVLGPVYTQNAHCSCLVTPDEPHNNCVRSCLQDKMWTLLANASRDRKPGDPPMDIDIACPLIWKHHRDCYHDCGCASEFIDYLAFDGVCNVALPCAVDSAAINLLNRCMPAPKND